MPRDSHSWTLGTVFVLRHAGFPFDWMEQLGMPAEVEQAALALLEAEDALAGAVRRCDGAKAEQKFRETFRQGHPVPPVAAADEDCQRALRLYQSRLDEVTTAYAQALPDLRQRLQDFARHGEIQEAVFLSAPNMYQNIWSRYLAAPAQQPANADTRRAERQIYTYLQRFCAKNETTSFFGPMGYGEVKSGAGFSVIPIPPQQRRRRTFHAFWVVQELAKRIAKDKTLRLHLPVRANPMFSLEWENLRARCPALGQEVPLDAQAVSVLKAVGAEGQSLAALAAQCGQTPQALERALVPLFTSAVLLRTLPFAPDTFEAFSNLYTALSQLPALPAREEWIGRLDRLERFRADFEKGDLPRRQDVLPQWEAAFEEITGLPARRGAGQMYMDRYVFYEEAASGFSLEVGEQFARGLENALHEGLELSAAYGQKVQEGYQRDVATKLGTSGSIDFLSYAMSLRPDAPGGSQFSPVPPLSWTEVPALLTWSAERGGGRFSLPDVCLHAPGPEAIAQGQCEVLLARVHHHLLLWSWLFAFYPHPDKVKEVASAWLRKDASAAGLVGLAIGRRNKGFYQFPQRAVAYTLADLLAFDAGTTLAASALTVDLSPQGPSLRGPNGEPLSLYLPLADFSTYPPFAALAHPLVLHAPVSADSVPPGNEPVSIQRITLGGAVYQRARWELGLPQIKKLQGVSLYLEAQRLKRSQALPRFVFARTATERKPCLIDFSSPFSLEMLRHLLHDQPRVRFEEMYPGPEGLWLQDERGRYTCELRMQAVR